MKTIKKRCFYYCSINSLINYITCIRTDQFSNHQVFSSCNRPKKEILHLSRANSADSTMLQKIYDTNQSLGERYLSQSRVFCSCRFIFTTEAIDQFRFVTIVNLSCITYRTITSVVNFCKSFETFNAANIEKAAYVERTENVFYLYD